MTKQEIWDDISKQVDSITDALDMHIDEKIKPVVIGLNALGITTSGSCGGHIDEDGRTRFPYLDFSAPNEPEYRHQNEENIINEILDKYKIEPRKKNYIFWPGNEAAEKEYYDRIRNAPTTKEYIEWDNKNFALERSVFNIVSLFNEQKGSNRLPVITYDPGPAIVCRLNNEEYIKTLSKEDLNKYVLEAQKEMDEFSVFLKNRFFNN